MREDFILASLTLVGLLLLLYLFFGFLSAYALLNSSDFEDEEETEIQKKQERLCWLIKNEQKTTGGIRLLIGADFLLLGILYSQRFLAVITIFVHTFFLQFVSAGDDSKLYPVVLAVVQILAALLFLYILYVFFVVLPTRNAVVHSERFALHAAPFVYTMVCIVSPVTASGLWGVNLLMKLLGRDTIDEGDVTEQEIISMVNEGHEQGVLLASEAEMITNIFEYGDKEVQDIMTNSSQIVGIPAEMSLREALDFMLGEQFSRFPVYKESLDHIVGILYLKDAMRMQSRGQAEEVAIEHITGLLREAYYVPQTLKIDSMFKKMQAEKIQMAIVIDEYGQTDGLISMEDILEEIVGNIFDEYDEDGKFIEEKGEDEYIIDGLTPLEELEDKLQISFDDELYETLNGFMISKLEHIPEINEKFSCTYKGFQFDILEVENRVIQRVLVKKILMENDEEGGLIETNQELVLEDKAK